MIAARSTCKTLPRCFRGSLGSRALSSGEGGPKDTNFEAMSADVSPSLTGQGKPAAKKPGHWESFFRTPTQKESSTPPSWDFLDNLKDADRKSRFGAATHSLTPSVRNLAKNGLDFLSDDSEGSIPTQKEQPACKTEPEEERNLQASTYKLIRDSFKLSSPQHRRDMDRKAAVDEKIGFDTSALFSTSEVPRGTDTRTLSELESFGSRYSSVDGSSLEIKSYTYEELGEKLCKVRPPKDQILYSATGLSFGELRTRIERIDQEGKERGDSKDADFKELHESLSHLRGSSPQGKPLTHEELSFVNRAGGMRRRDVKVEYTPPNDELLTKYYSEVQLSSKARLKLEIKKLKEEFQTHEYDTGSPQVQIAILTARINNLNRHMREGPNYKRDKHSKKGLTDMVQYRKRLLRYLRGRDWPVYCNVLTKLKLDDVILEKRR